MVFNLLNFLVSQHELIVFMRIISWMIKYFEKDYCAIVGTVWVDHTYAVVGAWCGSLLQFKCKAREYKILKNGVRFTLVM